MGLKYFDYPPHNPHNMQLSRIHIPLVGNSTCDARFRFEIAFNQACRNHFKPDLGGLITYCSRFTLFSARRNALTELSDLRGEGEVRDDESQSWLQLSVGTAVACQRSTHSCEPL